MKNILWKRGIVIGIIILFVGASIVTGIDENADLTKNRSLTQNPYFIHRMCYLHKPL